LLYRLDVISFQLPPLRERRGDILPLAESQLRQLARPVGQAQRFSEAARQALERYSWPGNIRELRNVIERATILSAGEEIEVADLPSSLSAGGEERRPEVGGPYSVEEIEAEHIRRVLARSRNLQQAAALLKLDPTTLLRKRKSFHL
jgi:NtrC-family two-component system response regulator AlgB